MTPDQLRRVAEVLLEYPEPSSETERWPGEWAACEAIYTLAFALRDLADEEAAA